MVGFDDWYPLRDFHTAILTRIDDDTGIINNARYDLWSRLTILFHRRVWPCINVLD